MPSYHVCGLHLASELEIPGLADAGPADAERAAEEGGGPPTVRILRGAVEAPERWPASGIAAWPAPDADVISWAGRARLRIAADEIVVDTDDERFARQCVVGPGLGLLLHRRGQLVLHGSALDVGGRAVVLLGHKGAGKSTTAAALLDRGHALLTDDLVVLDGAGRCLPGPVQMKLWPASAEAFGLDVEPFLDGLAKGVWMGARPATEACPIALVCSLGWGERVGLDAVAGTDAFGAVFEHVYAPRFVPGQAAPLIPAVAHLCQQAEVAKLQRPKEMGVVGDVVRVLEERLEAPVSR